MGVNMKRILQTITCFFVLACVISSQPLLNNSIICHNSNSFDIQGISSNLSDPINLNDLNSFNFSQQSVAASIKKINTKSTLYKPISALLNNGQERHSYTYDTKGNLLTKLIEVYDYPSYMGYLRFTNTYDLQGNISRAVTEIWLNTAWVNSNSHTYTTDTEGNILTDLSQTWSNGEWVNNFNDTYTYDSKNNILTDINEKWLNGTWENYFRNTYTYDTEGNLLVWLKDAWSFTGLFWDGYQRFTYTYDTRGNRLTYLWELWISYKNSDKAYNGFMLHTYTYDEQGYRISDFATVNSTNGWENENRHTYTNDSNGNMLTDFEETWTNNNWVNTARKNYTYDVNNNCTLGEFNEWLNGSWSPANGSLNIYYNNGNTVLDFTASTASIQYTSFTDVNDEINLPNSFLLSQNYPNPFNPVTTVQYSIPFSDIVTLKVYDVIGNEITTLVNEFKNAGTYEVNFNALNLSSGIYFYKIKSGNFNETKKMLLLK